MKFNIVTLGCKVNAYESEAMKELLIKDGFSVTEETDKADIVIVNTCSVTNMADSKSRKVIRRIRRENPDCILVVCGCSSQNHQEEYQDFNIDILLGNRKKSQIVSLIKNYINNKEKQTYFTNNRDLSFEDFNVEKFTSQTRAYIKIQDGCNNFCSYCIIPYVRGDIRSKDFECVLKEAACLAKNGHHEIVLTGIHTGSYNNSGKNLVDLIRELAKIKDLKRIRISSIEITELDEEFMRVLMEEPKVCNHLHIPLQSGSDEVLKRMNRKYNKEYFQKVIDKIREIRPNISITTDVIVGHPYESEEGFLECYNFCEKMNFSKIHVFPYSVRNGTAAAIMANQVSEADKKKRSQKLIELSAKLESNYCALHLNKECNVLIEVVDEKNGYSLGHTDNYLQVRVNEILDSNKVYNVKICEIKGNIAIGKILNK